MGWIISKKKLLRRAKRKEKIEMEHASKKGVEVLTGLLSRWADANKSKAVKTVAITDRQFGDNGKGKFADLFAEWADIIARGTGGDNCGHTTRYRDLEIITHLIPSGIRHDVAGKINIIGSGVVVYPKSLSVELAQIRELGMTCNNLCLAYNAKLITPAEILLDRIRESSGGKGKIGSTGKGIGPAYSDVFDRQGLLINDLLNPEFFRAKLERHLEYKRKILRNYDSETIKAIMHSEHLESGLYYEAENIFNTDAIYEKYLEYGREFQPLIEDTDALMRSSLGKSNILLEGAQGDMLSIKRGTYPFVTSSDCATAGLAEGVGLKETDIDLSLGIIKGFYMTRVGGGPFPTEFGAEKSERWCNGGEGSRGKESELYGHVSVNDKDYFIRGIAMRRAGSEYGATTGRPRRTGRLDLPLLRYTLTFNSPDMILTKLDVLNDCEIIDICDQYEYCGPTYLHAGKQIEAGDRLETAIPAAEVLQHCRPVYRSFPGWQKNLSGCADYESLPSELKTILEFVMSHTGIRPRIISIGPDREETIFL